MNRHASSNRLLSAGRLLAIAATGARVRKAAVNKASGCMIDRLESRRMMSVYQLTNGEFAGSLTAYVDGYGSLGYTQTGAGFATYTNNQGDNSATNPSVSLFDKSYVYFTPGATVTPNSARNFKLTEVASDVLGSDGTFPAPLATPIVKAYPSYTSITTQFFLAGTDNDGHVYNVKVDLVQTISSATGQSALTQTYTLTNQLQTPFSFGVTRYAELGQGMQSAYGAAQDGGRYVVATQVSSTDPYLSSEVYGGTLTQYAIQAAGFDGEIAAAGKVPTITPTRTGQVIGDASLTGATQTSYAGSFAQGSAFTIGGRASTQYSVVTKVALPPAFYITDSTLLTPNDYLPPTLSFAPTANTGGDIFLNVSRQAGFFVFDQPVANVSTSTGTSTLSVKVRRVEGSVGPASVIIVPVTSSTTAPSGSYSVTGGLLGFASGVTEMTATLTINGAASLPDNRIITLGFDTPSLAGVDIITSTVNVLPSAAGLQFATTNYAVVKGTPSSVFTVTRVGNLNGDATASVSFTGGTAVSGTDFTPPTTLVTFPDGVTTQTITVPILKSPYTGIAKTAIFSLTAGTASAVYGNASTTLTITDKDVIGPTVTGVSLVSSKSGISQIKLQFSESLSYTGSLSPFSLFLRTNEGAFGSGTRTAQVIKSATFTSPTTITLTPSKVLSLNQFFQITVSPSDQLTDLVANSLDANAAAAGNQRYNRIFAVGNSLSYVDESGDKVRLSVTDGLITLFRATTGEADQMSVVRTSGKQAVVTGSVGPASKPGTTNLGTVSYSSSSVLLKLSTKQFLFTRNPTTA